MMQSAKAPPEGTPSDAASHDRAHFQATTLHTAVHLDLSEDHDDLTKQQAKTQILDSLNTRKYLRESYYNLNNVPSEEAGKSSDQDEAHEEGGPRDSEEQQRLRESTAPQ